jgi:PAS domain S-box-containing protein
MQDGQTPNADSAEELVALQQRIRELEAKQSGRETELSGTRQRFEHLLAVSPAIIYATHASGDFACTYVSENIQTIMGFLPNEMTTDAKCWPAQLHPEDATRIFNELPPLIEQGGGTVEYRFRHREGHYVWIQDSFKVVYENESPSDDRRPNRRGRPKELVGAWADITSRKLAEERALRANAELQETKRSLTRLIESSPDAIISTNKDGSVVLFNEGAETLLGYRAEEIIGRAVTLLYGGEAAANEVLREMRKRGGTISGFDSVLWAKDGSNIPVLISASVLFDDDGNEIGTVGFATDLRDRNAPRRRFKDLTMNWKSESKTAQRS